MNKTTVSRLFIGSLITAGAGAIITVLAVSLATANDVFVMRGAAIVAIQGGALSFFFLGLGLVGGIAFAGAVIGGFAAWIGAIANTWHLDSKTWFVALVLLGIFNLGFFAMIAYLVAGPDGTAEGAQRTTAVAAGA